MTDFHFADWRREMEQAIQRGQFFGGGGKEPTQPLMSQHRIARLGVELAMLERG